MVKAALLTRPGATIRSRSSSPAATRTPSPAVNEAWVWIPLCLLFVLPFFDPRRPFRLLHLDLLVLLGLGVSLFFFNRGEITASVPLVYPVLAYFLFADAGRRLPAARAPRAADPVRAGELLAGGVLALLVARIVLNVVDSRGDRHRLRGRRRRRPDRRRARRLRRRLHDADRPRRLLRAAQLPGLHPVRAALPLGRRPRATCPRHTPPRSSSTCSRRRAPRARPAAARRRARAATSGSPSPSPGSPTRTRSTRSTPTRNDALVAALAVGAADRRSPRRSDRAVRDRARRRGQVRPARAGAAVRGGHGRARVALDGRCSRRVRLVVAVCAVPLLPDGGFREFYDRTFGYQASRGSPFSVWGLEPSLELPSPWCASPSSRSRSASSSFRAAGRPFRSPRSAPRC